MGRAKGSAGGMTASKVYDKNVLKAKAFEVNNPKTAAQQNQRTFFKEVSDLVNQLTEEQCRFLCPKAPKGMSRRNFLSKQLASYVTTSSGQKVVDLANVKTLGNAKEVEMNDISITIESNEITIDWDSTEGHFLDVNKYCLSFLIINTTKKQLMLANSDGTIGENITSIAKPQNWETTDNLTGFPFVVYTTTPLTGFGTMAAAERPMK